MILVLAEVEKNIKNVAVEISDFNLQKLLYEECELW